MSPTSGDSDDWVSATETRNHVLGDPLLDWLELYGEDMGFWRDTPDERTDYGPFVTRKGRQFEAAVMRWLRRLDIDEVLNIPDSLPGEARDSHVMLSLATKNAMSRRTPVIHQGMLRDDQTKTYGSPDLLIHSKLIQWLFLGHLPEDTEFNISAPNLDIGDEHYIVVDIKYATLHLNAAEMLDNSGSAPAHKAQLFIYNRALSEVQGYFPPNAFVLGRGWELTRRGGTARRDLCSDRLGAVPQYGSLSRGVSLSDAVDNAVDWVRRLRSEGRSWEVLPEASVPELRPNAKRDHGHWSEAVKKIASESEDLTMLYNVTARGRDDACAQGIARWGDPRLTPAAVGVNGPTTALRLQALLDVNRDGGPPVRPSVVEAQRERWIEPASLEFYVDFETVNDLDDRFDRIPDKGGQPLIFMIGCGHLELDDWNFECFVADQLTEAAEADIIERWLQHMADVAAERNVSAAPRVIHWSGHEVSSLEGAYNSVARRNPAISSSWQHLDWFDFLSQVVRAEPVVVRGEHGFGLKAMTNALADHGLIPTRWGAGPTDGLGAMVGAWWCQHELEHGNAEHLIDIDLMREIREYNEVDCKAMMEIVRYLRQNH